MSKGLKYGSFEVGDTIRAYDFPGIETYYIEGEIVEIMTNLDPQMYVVMVGVDSTTDSARVGDRMLVPLETEFDKIWKFDRVVGINP